MSNHTPEFVQTQLPFDETQYKFIPVGPHTKNITGQRFGRLVALGPVEKASNRGVVWLCRCDCGNLTKVRNACLGRTTVSCGCRKLEHLVAMTTNHGYGMHPLYPTWYKMVHRCHDPLDSGYKNYGHRGVTVCNEWRTDPQAFIDYASQLPHYGKKGHSLDRIDNDGNYEPGNVRWASKKTQSRNQRTNMVLTYNGETRCLAEWSEILKINYETLFSRLSHGWTIERAFTQPVQERHR